MIWSATAAPYTLLDDNLEPLAYRDFNPMTFGVLNMRMGPLGPIYRGTSGGNVSGCQVRDCAAGALSALRAAPFLSEEPELELEVVTGLLVDFPPVTLGGTELSPETLLDAAGANGVVLPVSSAIASCGDGTLDFGEQCDDGNVEGDDECSGQCTLTSTPPVAVPLLGGKGLAGLAGLLTALGWVRRRQRAAAPTHGTAA